MSAASNTNLQGNKPPNKPLPRGVGPSPPREGYPPPPSENDPKDPPTTGK